jgi:hypothetical protein
MHQNRTYMNPLATSFNLKRMKAALASGPAIRIPKGLIAAR